MKTIQKAYPERALAVQSGSKTYFTGRPCKHGHICDRNTVDASCVECRNVDREVRGRAQNREHMRQKRASMTPEERAIEQEKQRAANKAARLRDPERVRALERKHGKLKRQRHPERKCAETRARQAAKLQRTPKWADLRAIREIYEARPAGFEVDHIIPLQGENVSGLHVAENLQYLRPGPNKSKTNNFDPDWINPDGTWALPDFERLAA